MGDYRFCGLSPMLIGEARKPSMCLPTTTLATAAAALFVICSTVSAAQTGQGVVWGEATDSSGGVLPGVTVVATAADGRVLATTVTDPAGGYVFRALAAGPVILRFELEGFTSVVVRLGVQAGADSRVVERLEVAPISETVVVYGDVPVDPSPFVPSSPPPVVSPVPTHDRDSVCGPAKPDASPESFGTIRSGRYEAKAGLYTEGAELIIDGGVLNGLHVGRNLVVRRYFRVRGLGLAGADVIGEHSVGLLQIVAAGESVDCRRDVCLRRTDERRFSGVVQARIDPHSRSQWDSRLPGRGPDSLCG